MKEIKPPDSLAYVPGGAHPLYTTMFLAGSIEMGVAENWQQRVICYFDGVPSLTILNPRRDDWDSSWKQTIEDPQFYGQVNWELDGIWKADIVLFYFQPGTKSPVSMLELGLVAGERIKAIVICPEGFWRKGNIDIVCKRYDITTVPTLDSALEMLRNILNERNK